MPHPDNLRKIRWMKKLLVCTMRLLTKRRKEVTLPPTSTFHSLPFGPVFYIQFTNNFWQFRYGHALVEFDPKVERKLCYKIDLYIVPTVALLYLFCFIDRANIGKLACVSLPDT